MDYFSFICKEYDGLRYSYDRKYVYILKGDFFYYRRLAKGRLKQDELRRFAICPAFKQELLKLLSSEDLLKNKTQHFPKDEMGICQRIEVGIQNKEQHFYQLYTGEEAKLWEEKPCLDTLWRLLQRNSQAQPMRSPTFTYLADMDLSFCLEKEYKLKKQKERLQYELKNGILNRKNLNKGSSQKIELYPAAMKKLQQFFQEEWENLSQKDGKTVQGKTALLDDKLHMSLDVRQGGNSLSLDMHNWQFNLISQLPFLLMEELEAILNRMLQTQGLRSQFPQTQNSSKQARS